MSWHFQSVQKVSGHSRPCLGKTCSQHFQLRVKKFNKLCPSRMFQVGPSITRKIANMIKLIGIYAGITVNAGVQETKNVMDFSYFHYFNHIIPKKHKFNIVITHHDYFSSLSKVICNFIRQRCVHMLQQINIHIHLCQLSINIILDHHFSKKK